MDHIISSFVTKNTGLVNQLTNEVTIYCNDKSLKVKALWDTGATHTCISTNVVKELNLISTGKTLIRTPSGEATKNQYLVSVLLPNNVQVKDIVVNDSEIGSQGFDILIGMNIINLGNFAVSNYNGKTYFSFETPATKHIDFVAELQKLRIIGQKHGKGNKKRKK